MSGGRHHSLMSFHQPHPDTPKTSRKMTGRLIFIVKHRFTGLKSLFNERLKTLPGDKTDQCIQNFAVFEQKHHGYTPDAIGGGCFGVFVHIHFCDLDLVFVGHGQFFQYRPDGTAGTAPGCPEINERRFIRFYNFLLELTIIDVNKGAFCPHFQTLLGSSRDFFRGALLAGF
jgi:hypothetical protein